MKLAALLIAFAMPAIAETPCDSAHAAYALANKMHVAMMDSQIETLQNINAMMLQKPPEPAMRSALLHSFDAAKASAKRSMEFTAEFTSLSVNIGIACP